MLRTGTSELAQPVDAFRTVAPNGNARGHIRVLVTHAEPIAQALLRTRSIIVDGDVDSLRDRECFRIALSLIQEAPQALGLLDEVGRGRRARPHPAVAKARRTLKGHSVT